MALLRCSWVSPPSFSLSCPARLLMPTKLPCASYRDIPYSSVAFRCFSVWLVSASSTERSWVPASAPMMPWCANAANVPTVVSILRPNLLAVEPTLFNASPKSLTLPRASPAPAASRSAICVASAPVKLNWAMAELMYSAAWPTSMPSDAARFNAPLKPPERISEVDRPALPSSLMASADSVAEYMVSAPASMAA